MRIAGLSLAVLLATALAGCAVDTGTDEPDPALDGLLDVSGGGGKADGVDIGQHLLDTTHPGVARISAAGAVFGTWDTNYADTLHYDLPASGVRILDGFVDGEDDVGIPDGSFTEMSVIVLDKPAALHGLLEIDTDDQDLAIQVLYRVAGSSSVRELPYLNRDHVFDIGRIDQEVRYVAIIAPGGTRSGAGSQRFDHVKFRIVDPTR